MKDAHFFFSIYLAVLWCYFQRKFNSFRYFCMTDVTLNCSSHAVSIDLISPANTRKIDVAITELLPTGTNSPYLPPLSISFGPQGQSVATIGVPSANASIRTPGNASKREDKTSRDAARI